MDILPIELIYLIINYDEVLYNNLIRAYPRLARASGDQFDQMIKLGYDVRITNEDIKCTKPNCSHDSICQTMKSRSINWIKFDHVATSTATLTLMNNSRTHRRLGPAIICEDGTQIWFKNGVLENDNGPAYICANGDRIWCKNNHVHCDNGPAYIRANGDRIWCKNKLIHRKYLPAIITNDLRFRWYTNGVMTYETSLKYILIWLSVLVVTKWVIGTLLDIIF